MTVLDWFIEFPEHSSVGSTPGLFAFFRVGNLVLRDPIAQWPLLWLEPCHWRVCECLHKKGTTSTTGCTYSSAIDADLLRLFFQLRSEIVVENNGRLLCLLSNQRKETCQEPFFNFIHLETQDDLFGDHQIYIMTILSCQGGYGWNCFSFSKKTLNSGVFNVIPKSPLRKMETPWNQKCFRFWLESKILLTELIVSLQMASKR